MRQPDQSIIGAVELAFSGGNFIPLDAEDVARLNDLNTGSQQGPIYGGSYRIAEAFDAQAECPVWAIESYLSGREDSGEDLEGAHLVEVIWEDASMEGYLVELDSGEVLDTPLNAEFDVESHDWKLRVMKALSLIAEERIGVA